MKHTKLSAAAILTAIAVLNISCIKRPPDVVKAPGVQSKNKTENEVQQQEENPEQEKIPEPEEILISAKVLSPESQLCLLGRDKKIHQIIKINSGENISVIFTDSREKTLETENKIYSGAVYKEVEYWVEKKSIALQCENALVLKKAFLYADKDFNLPTDEKNSPFKFGDFVFRSTNQEDESEAFDRIYYYSKNSKKVETAFIKKGLLTTRTDDLIVMDCVFQLRRTKRATPRNEIFKRAAKYNPCAEITAALEAEKTEKVENNYQDVLNALPGAKYKVNLPELLTVDQSKDPFQ